MKCDFYQLANPGVRDLTPYEPGKPIDELERELGISGSIKLASNENPLGAGALAIEAARSALSELSRYPDGAGFRLKAALARKFDLDQSRIVLGAGSSDLLRLAVEAFVCAGDQVVMSQYAFAMYAIYAQAAQAERVIVPARDWGHDLDAMAAAVTERTRLLFIANPNNPTGTWVKQTELVRLLKRLPAHVMVVLDEAYAEYIDQADYPNGMALGLEFPNLIVMRTFSKAYGLAALRVGYAIADPAVADLMNRIREPFNVNSIAQAAAEAALADEVHLQRSKAVNQQGLMQLQRAVAQLGLEAIPSVGNFIAIDMGREALPIYEALLRKGLIVRPLAGYGMPNHLRVTAATESENSRFIKALQEVLEAV